MSASFEDVSWNIGIVSNDLEEDLEEESTHIVNGEYDSVGAGGSDNDDITEKNKGLTKHNPLCTPVEFLADSTKATTFLYKQYRLSLQKSIVISPLFILYCCAKDALH